MSTTDGAAESRLREAAFDSDIVPQLVLDASGLLVAVNLQGRQRLALTSRDIGRPFQDLEISYRPVDLRSALDRAAAERRDVTLAEVQWPHGAELRFVDIILSPIFDDGRTLLGTRISFQDVTVTTALRAQLQHTNQELETAYEELQSTNEELETTNEELQSTVEELETTNEELQSTNEELETMNEELQSTNEELQTMNDELRSRGGDLNAANEFLESVFGSLRSAVVVLNREYRVKVWNGRAADLWGLREEEVVGRNIVELDTGLPIAELRGELMAIFAGAKASAEVTVPATNRRGRTVECRVSLSPLRGGDRSVAGVILLIDELPQGAGAS